VSVDASSAALLEHDGAQPAVARMATLRPHVVFANELEADVLGSALHPDALGGAMVVVKHGAGPAVLHRSGTAPVEVAAIRVEGVRDTTGAGDAFAAGFLLALADGADPIDAIRHAHQVAASSLRT
jgi:sugar/nucleoside kinase (ribokinase family)